MTRLLEKQIQVAVAQALDSAGVLWCHVPNESRREAKYGAMLRRRGMKAGVPDVLIFERPRKGRKYRGVALELKTATGQVREAQMQWLNDLAEAGWCCYVCYGLDDAMEALANHGYIGGI